MLHRPLGIGVQGLADVFALMDIAFDSDKAIQLNKDIFETIYYAALITSMELSRERNEEMGILREALDNDYLLVNNSDDPVSSFTLSSTCKNKIYRDKLEKLLKKHNPNLAEMNKLNLDY